MESSLLIFFLCFTNYIVTTNAFNFYERYLFTLVWYYSWDIWASIYWRQTKVRIPLRSNVVDQVLVGLLTWVWGKGYFQEKRWLNDSGIAESSPQHGWPLIKVGTLEHTAQPAGCSVGWRVPFQPFRWPELPWVAGWSVPPRWLGWSELLLKSPAYLRVS